jgi:hypothetical protein
MKFIAVASYHVCAVSGGFVVIFHYPIIGIAVELDHAP